MASVTHQALLMQGGNAFAGTAGWFRPLSAAAHSFARSRLQVPSIVDPSSYAQAWIPHAAGVNACDLYFANVKLLMGFEGADGATGAPGFTDESSAAHGTATVNANAQISTAKSKFGASSYLNDGSGDYIQYAAHNDWQLSAANSDEFTVECLINPTATGASLNDRYFFWQNTGSPKVCWFFGLQGSAQLQFSATANGSTNWTAQPSSAGLTWTIGQWYAVAADKDSAGKLRLYVDGVMVASGTPVTSAIFNGVADSVPLNIGGTPALGSFSFPGYIDEARITKGKARYASDSGYTPATTRFPRQACSAAPPSFVGWQPPVSLPNYLLTRSRRLLTSIADASSTAGAWIPAAAGATAGDSYFNNVVLLMGYEGADASTGAPGMTDESPAAHGTAIAAGGTIDTAQFKFGSSSLKNFAIIFPDSADWDLGSGLFTVECRIRTTTVAAGSAFIVAQWQTIGSLGWVLSRNGAAINWNVSTTGGDNLTDLAGGSLSINTWYAVCVDYDGSKYRLYIDGVMVASSSTARTINNSSQPLAIGSNSLVNSFSWAGNIDEMRLTKGVGRYASDAGYTPATTRFPRQLLAATTPQSVGWQQTTSVPNYMVARTRRQLRDASAYPMAFIEGIPLAQFQPSTAIATTLSGGNLVATSTSSATNQGARLNNAIAKSTGKYYFEITLTNLAGGGATTVGVGTITSNYTNLGTDGTSGATMEPSSLGQIFSSGSSIAGLGTRSTGDVIGIAIDLDNKKAWFRVAPSGNWNGIIGNDPATTTGGVSVPAGLIVPFVTFNLSSNVFSGNFGATAFTGTAPSGFTSGWTP